MQVRTEQKVPAEGSAVVQKLLKKSKGTKKYLMEEKMKQGKCSKCVMQSASKDNEILDFWEVEIADTEVAQKDIRKVNESINELAIVCGISFLKWDAALNCTLLLFVA